MIRYANMQ